MVNMQDGRLCVKEICFQGFMRFMSLHKCSFIPSCFSENISVAGSAHLISVEQAQTIAAAVSSLTCSCYFKFRYILSKDECYTVLDGNKLLVVRLLNLDTHCFFC